MKRLLTGALALILSIAASATTLNPVQLLNPAGSSSGQTIVSTGGSTAPVWGGVGVNGIAAISANTVLANATASSASPTAFAMPSCATALEWTAGTGFVCNTAGAFTTLSATGLITPTSTIGIKGTATNDSAQAGSVGEFPTPTNLSGVVLSAGAPFNAASISLTAGDWDVSGTIAFNNGTGTSQSVANASISTTTVTQNAAIGFMNSIPYLTPSPATPVRLSSPVVRMSLTTTTTVFLVGVSSFSGGTATADGLIRARRVR